MKKTKYINKKEKTLNELVEEWLEYKKITVKESSYCRYLYIIKQYINPYFKDISLNDLEEYDFNKFVAELLKNQTPNSVKNIIIIFKSILKYGEKKYNYRFMLDFIAVPKTHKEELRVLSKNEKNKLEKYCLSKNTLRDIGIIVCLNTGLRVGEICALKWEDINLEKRYIKVTHTMQRIYNKEEQKSSIKIDIPKSQTSLRIIPISKKLYNILKPLKQQYKKKSYFLTGSSTSFIEPRNYQNMFKLRLNDCKIKDFHFHQLRHTFATDCINVGMDTKSLSEVLGHSNIEVTLDKYVHSSYDSKKKFLEML